MSDILGPTEVDAYRKIPHADFGVFRYSGLIATIDALAEALRAASVSARMLHGHYEAKRRSHCFDCQRDYQAFEAACAHVATWLEESNG